jgi:hypothetical protein
MLRIALLLAVLPLAACSSPRPDAVPVRADSLRAEPVPLGAMDDGPQALAASRATWEAQRPADYRFTYARSCFCPPQYRGPFDVTVRSGAVADVAYKGEGEPIDRPLTEYQTVDDLFALLAEAYARNAARVDVTYDPATGQPTSFYIDYDEQMADEEVGFTVEPARPVDG